MTSGDATAAYVEIEISEPYTTAVYAFLKPTDESMSKYVSGSCVVGSPGAGIRIVRGSTRSTIRGIVRFKDGSASGTTLRFSIVLCTSSKYDETKRIAGFTSNDITLTVTNVAPVVNDIYMNDWCLNADKTAFKGVATVGITQTFAFDVLDAVRDLDGTDAEAMKIAYTFTDGNTTDPEKECTGNPATWVIQRRFKTVGADTCSISYTITDKDGGQVTGSAYITVLDNPYISITGDTTSFDECDRPSFALRLSEVAYMNLTVRLTVTSQSAGDEKGGLEIRGGTKVSEGVYDFIFSPGADCQYFSVSEADGTSGGASAFNFTAEVTNTSVMPGTLDTRWCDFYAPGTLGPITVQNVAPALVVNGRRFDDLSAVCSFNASDAPTFVAVGPGNAITWNVDDVSADLAKGVQVTIADPAGSHTYEATDTMPREFTPQFTHAGPTTVTLTATDSDGGSMTVTIHYSVKSPDPIPDIGDNPTAKQVSEALAGSADARLVENITDGETYNAFRSWAGTAAEAQAVKESLNAWVSFALGQDALLDAPLTDEDVTIESFKPAAEDGKFEFVVGVKNIAVGSEAAKENLKKVFGLEGSATLDDAEFSSDKVDIEFASPENGKVRFSARPKDAAQPAFFMKVKVL